MVTGGIAVGCAMYGLQRVREREQFDKKTGSSKSSKVISLSDNNNTTPASGAGTAAAGAGTSASSGAIDESPDIVPFQQSSFSAYQGKEFDVEELEDAVVDWLPWITHTEHTSQQSLINAAVERIAKGKWLTLFTPFLTLSTHSNLTISTIHLFISSF